MAETKYGKIMVDRETFENMKKDINDVHKLLHGEDGEGGVITDVAIIKRFLKSIDAWIKILAGVLLIPIIAGVIALAGDHEKVVTMSNNYVSSASLELILKELSTQNQLLVNADLSTKENIIDLKAQYKELSTKIDRIGDIVRVKKSTADKN